MKKLFLKIKGFLLKKKNRYQFVVKNKYQLSYFVVAKICRFQLGLIGTNPIK